MCSDDGGKKRQELSTLFPRRKGPAGCSRPEREGTPMEILRADRSGASQHVGSSSLGVQSCHPPPCPCKCPNSTRGLILLGRMPTYAALARAGPGCCLSRQGQLPALRGRGLECGTPTGGPGANLPPWEPGAECCAVPWGMRAPSLACCPGEPPTVRDSPPPDTAPLFGVCGPPPAPPRRALPPSRLAAPGPGLYPLRQGVQPPQALDTHPPRRCTPSLGVCSSRPRHLTPPSGFAPPTLGLADPLAVRHPRTLQLPRGPAPPAPPQPGREPGGSPRPPLPPARPHDPRYWGETEAAAASAGPRGASPGPAPPHLLIPATRGASLRRHREGGGRRRL